MQRPLHGVPADTQRTALSHAEKRVSPGFALTALCIGAQRKWIAREQAKDRVRRALRSYTSGKVFAINGWFYHFIDVHTGERWKDVEVSTSDCICC